jgi:hypothetical protein
MKINRESLSIVFDSEIEMIEFRETLIDALFFITAFKHVMDIPEHNLCFDKYTKEIHFKTLKNIISIERKF